MRQALHARGRRALASALLGMTACGLAGIEPVDLVTPLMGTDSEQSLSAGNVYPDISRPWGMNSWTPQTA